MLFSSVFPTGSRILRYSCASNFTLNHGFAEDTQAIRWECRMDSWQEWVRRVVQYIAGECLSRWPKNYSPRFECFARNFVNILLLQKNFGITFRDTDRSQCATSFLWVNVQRAGSAKTHFDYLNLREINLVGINHLVWLQDKNSGLSRNFGFVQFTNRDGYLNSSKEADHFLDGNRVRQYSDSWNWVYFEFFIKY